MGIIFWPLLRPKNPNLNKIADLKAYGKLNDFGLRISNRHSNFHFRPSRKTCICPQIFAFCYCFFFHFFQKLGITFGHCLDQKNPNLNKIAHLKAYGKLNDFGLTVSNRHSQGVLAIQQQLRWRNLIWNCSDVHQIKVTTETVRFNYDRSSDISENVGYVTFLFKEIKIKLKIHHCKYDQISEIKEKMDYVTLI